MHDLTRFAINRTGTVRIYHVLAWHTTGVHLLQGLPNENVTLSTDLIDGARGLNKLAKLCYTICAVWRAFNQACKLVNPDGYKA